MYNKPELYCEEEHLPKKIRPPQKPVPDKPTKRK